MQFRQGLKQVTGWSVAAVNPQCRHDRCIFVLAHMRCGSTALSNILCSRPDVSGYGESHVAHDGRGALGRIVVNQALRGSWQPRAQHLFDKILHDRHDRDAPDSFYRARAILIAREPGPAIRSIRELYDKLGRNEYRSDAEAALYYADRIESLLRHWARFPADRRVGLTHAALLAAPEAALDRISVRLDIRPPLTNHYVSPAASRKGGGGDPTASGRFNGIQARPGDADAADTALRALDLPIELSDRVRRIYDRFAAEVGT